MAFWGHQKRGSCLGFHAPRNVPACLWNALGTSKVEAMPYCALNLWLSYQMSDWKVCWPSKPLKPCEQTWARPASPSTEHPLPLKVQLSGSHLSFEWFPLSHKWIISFIFLFLFLNVGQSSFRKCPKRDSKQHRNRTQLWRTPQITTHTHTHHTLSPYNETIICRLLSLQYLHPMHDGVQLL